MNAVEVIVDLLKECAAVSALVGTRVYGSRAPGDADLFPCVVVNRTGGETHPEPPIDESIFEIRCYDDDQPGAEAVYRTVKTLDGRNNIVTENGDHVYAFNEEGAPSDDIENVEQSNGWFLVAANFRAAIAQ